MTDIVCPYCGYIFSDSYMYGHKDLQYEECPDCDRIFKYFCDVHITYSSVKLDTNRRNRVFGGEIFGICCVCGSQGIEYMCECCHRLICSECEQSNRVCCRDYQTILDQCNEVSHETV